MKLYRIHLRAIEGDPVFETLWLPAVNIAAAAARAERWAREHKYELQVLEVYEAQGTYLGGRG